MKTLTISIAAYNVEKFLSKTLSELADERLSKYIEVLIIDDGSKDKTGLIASEYQSKYPDVFKYVHKENGGHGSTINKGMELATGKYFRVLDGDDSLDINNLLLQLERMNQYDEDMFISDFRSITSSGKRYIDKYVMKNGKNIFEYLSDNAVYAINDDIPYMQFIGLSTLSIKTELLRKYPFVITEKCYYVDIEFVVYCMALAKSFRYFSQPVYLYLQDENSGNSINKENMKKNIKMQEKVSEKLLSIHQELKKNNMLIDKEYIIEQRIIATISATIRTYLLMDDTKRRIKAFEKVINIESIDIFNKMNRSFFIHVLRSGNYMLVPLIALVYRCYVKWKY